jgi:hypothetical protein
MDEQEAVIEPAEPTVETESAPVESSQDVETTETSSSQEEQSADTTVGPKKVSETVPYERFKEVNSKLNDPEFIAQKAREMGIVQEQAQPTSDYVAPVEMANEMFDSETVAGVRQLIAQERENERAQDFVEKHGSELQENRLLAAVVKDIIRENNQSGKRIDQFKALELARKEVEKITSPQVTQAKAEGEQEGREIANKKEMLGAIGGTAGKQALDESVLSSKEYAEYKGLKYVE